MYRSPAKLLRVMWLSSKLKVFHAKSLAGQASGVAVVYKMSVVRNLRGGWGEGVAEINFFRGERVN